MTDNPTIGDITSAVSNAIGPMEKYAMGYMNPVGTPLPANSQGTGYIATMKLSVGSVTVDEAAILDEGTAGIVTYDRCEAADANISQINMGTASSFCGLNGALWGHDLAKAKLSGLAPKFTVRSERRRHKGADLPVLDATPLLDATYRLFGTVTDANGGQYRHPPLPGSHIICANKSVTAVGPAYAWSFIAVAIPDDSMKNKQSKLFIEDCGTIPAQVYTNGMDEEVVVPSPAEVKLMLNRHEDAVARSVTLCGEDYGAPQYQKLYASSRAIYAGPGRVACALACAPYVLLAQNDKPSDWSVRDLVDKSIGDWEQKVWPGKTLSYPYPDRDVVVPTGIEGG